MSATIHRTLPQYIAQFTMYSVLRQRPRASDSNFPIAWTVDSIRAVRVLNDVTFPLY